MPVSSVVVAFVAGVAFASVIAIVVFRFRFVKFANSFRELHNRQTVRLAHSEFAATQVLMMRASHQPFVFFRVEANGQVVDADGIGIGTVVGERPYLRPLKDGSFGLYTVGPSAS